MIAPLPQLRRFTLNSAALPPDVGSQHWQIASVQVDNYSGKWIEVDGTELVPPYTRGWVTTLAPTPKLSVKLAITTPPVGTQPGNDGAVIVTIYEAMIGSSSGVSAVYGATPEVVSMVVAANSSPAGTAGNLTLTQLGITGGNFYIHEVAMTYQPTGVAPANGVVTEINFATPRGDGLCVPAISPANRLAVIPMNKLFVNAPAVPWVAYSDGGAPLLYIMFLFSQA